MFKNETSSVIKLYIFLLCSNQKPVKLLESISVCCFQLFIWASQVLAPAVLIFINKNYLNFNIALVCLKFPKGTKFHFKGHIGLFHSFHWLGLIMFLRFVFKIWAQGIFTPHPTTIWDSTVGHCMPGLHCCSLREIPLKCISHAY